MGTVQDRPERERRPAMGGRHWRPSPPSKREVPPEAAEGVIEGANSFARGGGLAEPGRKGLAWKFYRGRKNRGFAKAKWEFCKLPSGSWPS